MFAELPVLVFFYVLMVAVLEMSLQGFSFQGSSHHVKTPKMYLEGAPGKRQLLITVEQFLASF